MTKTAELSSELALAAASLFISIADNKYFLARRLATWGVGAPTLESAVASTAVAQEEAGHARVLYSLLADLPHERDSTPLELEEDGSPKHALSYLAEPSTSFIRGIAALALSDRAFSVLLRAGAESSFDGLRRRVTRILADEGFHQRYADGRVREFARSPALQREFVALLPETLCWFGPSGEPGLEQLFEARIISQRNEELRQSFLASLVALAEKTGLELPISRTPDNRWSYPELPWTEWDSQERRLRATPKTTS